MSGSNLSGSGLPSDKDPFGCLVGFGSKSSGKVNNDAKNDPFGNFQSTVQSNPSSGSFSASNIDFGVQSTVPQPSSGNDDPLGMFSASSNSSAAPAEDCGFESFDGWADSGGGCSCNSCIS